jgi:hypothetical protein
MMVIAQVMANGDFSRSIGQAIFFLILTGVALFTLKVTVLVDSPVSSGYRLRRRIVPRLDAFSAPSHTGGPDARAVQDSREPKRGGDKRRFLRRKGNPVSVLVSEAQNLGMPTEGLVLDRSRGGLFLSVPHKINVGCLLAVRTPDFPDSIASVRLRVRHCKQKGQEWRIGCQFVEDLPWSVLLLFG